MRTSKYLLATVKEAPNDSSTISHQLMIRSGMIRQVASGIYNYLPLGLKVLRKVEEVVRDEMNKAGAIEVLMPAIQPAELWMETGRWNFYGKELLRLKDRHNREFCVGPTHEEVITDLARNEITSYKQLPLNFYQIQTKFRDEVRPRFGVMRGREFVMKDAYSFHINQESLQETYNKMYEAYVNIFKRLGLKFVAVNADNGSIGGTGSHEFQVLADSGEDEILYTQSGSYAANIEKATSKASKTQRDVAKQTIELVATPNTKTIADLVNNFNIEITKTIKTLIVKANNQFYAICLKGDDELNEIKLTNLIGEFTFANEEEVLAKVGANFGSIGPVKLNPEIRIIADIEASLMADFACGANINDKHFFNVNWDKDTSYQQTADLRLSKAGEIAENGEKLLSARGIEVGHIFQLGDKYSKSMKATVLDENGKEVIMTMGCYGIGVSRIVAAAIEQNFDERGIIWSDNLAPFQIALVPMKYEKEEVRNLTDEIYQKLSTKYEVLLDDRDKKTSAGIKFADMDLIGIPHRIVISDKLIEQGVFEYKHRKSADKQEITLDKLEEFLASTIKSTN